MRSKLLILALVFLISLMATVPAFAHNAGPCNDSGEPGNSDYAKHHIVAVAHDGDLGAVDHDGDGMKHYPGVHQGFSTCNPSGK